MPLVHIEGRLNVYVFVTLVRESVVLSVLQGEPNTVFQKGNAKSHNVRRAPYSLIEFDFLPCPVNYPDVNSMKYLRDLTGSDMNRGPRAQTVSDLRTAVDVA
ncbi:hypothetical protein TNCV_2412101 [Trichonephila clavipes]|nr:hypothetical protein TNCV_2412101 [Trichonephila clavipes]